MSGFLWRMSGALAAGVLGLTLIFWQLEHAQLHAFAGLGRPSPAVYALLFAGLLLLNFSVFYALTRWARFVREHPDTRQLPPWFLIAIIVISGGVLVTGIAVHAGYLRSLDPLPMTISQGFVAFEAAFASLALVPLVLLAVRWSGGYRR
ncbi:hypothetical protein [Demequina mangrovi]|uniref:Uncharacterized protein n=1 Tax=Demequina mangrovi TaxID=1043493 RepID=A0A1H6ZKA3_9MICO|nr:hypothetical protein [Demequina mangrovi]SEJ50122.1 hypothetical protein SAMN05421637_2036 [Demequina mangrovi]